MPSTRPWGSPEPSIRSARRVSAMPPPPPIDDHEREERRQWREKRSRSIPTTRTETDMSQGEETKGERIRRFVFESLEVDIDVEAREIYEDLPDELAGMKFDSFANTYFYSTRKQFLETMAGGREEDTAEPAPERSDPAPGPSATSDTEPFGTPDATPTDGVGVECRSEPEEEDLEDVRRLKTYEETEIRAARVEAVAASAEPTRPEPDTICVNFGRRKLSARKLPDGRWSVTCDSVSDRLLRDILVELFPPAAEGIR